MKKLLIITLILLSSCETLRIRLASPETKKHTESGEIEFALTKNEQAWSRLNYYIFIYLGYAQAELYNPYIIHVINEKPYREITAARELGESAVKIIIRYTADIEAKYNEDYSNQDSKFDADITSMKNLIEDMLEYAATGKHKYDINKKEMEAGKVSPAKKPDRKGQFFFY